MQLSFSTTNPILCCFFFGGRVFYFIIFDFFLCDHLIFSSTLFSFPLWLFSHSSVNRSAILWPLVLLVLSCVLFEFLDYGVDLILLHLLFLSFYQTAYLHFLLGLATYVSLLVFSLCDPGS